MNRNIWRGTIVACGLLISLLVSARLASAHHSYAMFDRTKAVTVSGTVAKYDLRNPHMFLWVYVKNPSTGKQEVYAFEGGSRNMLERQGWNNHTFAEGEKLTITYNPLKDGRTGGYLVKAVKADGSVIGGDPAAGPGDGTIPGVSGAAAQAEQEAAEKTKRQEKK